MEVIRYQADHDVVTCCAGKHLIAPPKDKELLALEVRELVFPAVWRGGIGEGTAAPGNWWIT